MVNQRKNNLLSQDEQKELELLEKTKNEGFLDEEVQQKNKKAGAPLAPLGGGHAYYFDYSDPHPSIEEVFPLEFQPAGKIFWYYYPQNKDLPPEQQIKEGDLLVAYSERGMELAKVLRKSENDYKAQSKIDFIKNVRKATPEDLKREEILAERAREAWQVCERFNRELGITMKIRKVKITLDDSKVIVYFTAPGRVDFRELIKRLASALHRRIEMRQIGVRDTTKMLGALGPCGMELCCRRFLHSFMPVSVKMAKDQNLSLNPHKISGNCGRLFCCLAYENSLYDELRKSLPREETEVAEQGTKRRGFVKKVNALAGTVSIVFPSTETESYEEWLVSREQLMRDEQNRWIVLPAPPAPLHGKTNLPADDDLSIPPFRPEKVSKGSRKESSVESEEPANRSGGGKNPAPSADRPASDREKSRELEKERDGRERDRGRNRDRDRRRRNRDKDKKKDQSPSSGGTSPASPSQPAS